MNRGGKSPPRSKAKANLRFAPAYSATPSAGTPRNAPCKPLPLFAL